MSDKEPLGEMETLSIQGDESQEEKQEKHAPSIEAFVLKDGDPVSLEKLRKFISDMEQLENSPIDESKPYEQKYQAYEHLESLEKQLAELKHEDQTEEMKSLHGKVLLRMGIIAYDTDEWSKGEKHIKDSIRLLQKDEGQQTQTKDQQGDNAFDNLESSQYTKDKPDMEDLSPAGVEIVECTTHGSVYPRSIELVVDLAQAYNYLGMIWTGRADHRLAELCFKKSETIYHKFHEYRTENGVQDDDPLVKQMEITFTMITFYLAQMYSHLSFPHLSAKYSFLTLNRQLNGEEEFDKEEWAINAMTLSNYYLNYDDFGQSEHCLNAAKHMMEQIENKRNEQSEPNLQLTIARHHHVWLDYSVRWLMDNRRRPDSEQESQDQKTRELEFLEPESAVPIPPKHNTPAMQFDNLPIDPPKQYTVISSFEQALPAFKAARRGYEAGLEYYVLDGFVTDHIGNLQNLSRLYSVLTSFEKDLERTIAMHERRAQLYEKANLLNELNPQYYNGELKQISFELGEIYSEILDLSLVAARDKKAAFSNRKLVEAARKAIRCFQFFIEQFVDPDSGQEKIEDINRHAYIRARLHLARLYYKLEVKDTRETLQNWTISMQEYDKAIKLCNEKKVEGLIEQEIEMAKQMRDLIPLKMREYILRNGMH